MIDFAGQVAVVTGWRRGIGLLNALELDGRFVFISSSAGMFGQHPEVHYTAAGLRRGRRRHRTARHHRLRPRVIETRVWRY